MDIEEVKELTVKGASETLELKKSTGGREGAAATVCAMLNRSGGTVLFGVEPNGRIVGQDVGEQTIEQLLDEFEHIAPQNRPFLERVPFEGSREIIAITVEPGIKQPYRYRGIVYQRFGNTNRKMTDDEVEDAILERRHGTDRWELVPMYNWTLNDLDGTEIDNTIALARQHGRLRDLVTGDREDILDSLGLTNDGVLCRAAAVLFGKPGKLANAFPQCKLRLAQFRGFDKNAILNNRQIVGNMFVLLSEAMEFFNLLVPRVGEVSTTSFLREDRPLYPTEAVREALANAFSHRDYIQESGSVDMAFYDDRLVIQSDGGLHFGLTPKDLLIRHKSQPWNPRIARVLYLRGIIEEWGTGTLEMSRAAVASGLPLPVIEESRNSVSVTFYREKTAISRNGNDIADRTRDDVCNLLRNARQGLTLKEIQISLLTPVSIPHLRRVLKKLRDGGRVKLIGRSTAAKWHHVKERDDDN